MLLTVELQGLNRALAADFWGGPIWVTERFFAQTLQNTILLHPYHAVARKRCMPMRSEPIKTNTFCTFCCFEHPTGCDPHFVYFVYAEWGRFVNLSHTSQAIAPDFSFRDNSQGKT